MSCGDAHDVDCRAVLDRIYEFLNAELDEAAAATIHQHLQACGPCLEQVDVERVVHILIHRSCPCMPAPEHLRMSIVTRIEQLRSTGGQFA